MGKPCNFSCSVEPLLPSCFSQKSSSALFIDVIGFENNYNDTSIPIVKYLEDRNFVVIHKSLDKNIESIKSKKYRIQGLMWHPERDSKPKLFNINLFKKFFNK